MKKAIIKIIMNCIHDGLEDDEVLLLYSIVGKIRETFIDFETEYQLKEFRELQSSYFDETGKAYTGTIFNLDMCERMLKLIDQLETEIS